MHTDFSLLTVGGGDWSAEWESNGHDLWFLLSYDFSCKVLFDCLYSEPKLLGFWGLVHLDSISFQPVLRLFHMLLPITSVCPLHATVSCHSSLHCRICTGTLLIQHAKAYLAESAVVQISVVVFWLLGAPSPPLCLSLKPCSPVLLGRNIQVPHRLLAVHYWPVIPAKYSYVQKTKLTLV